jgi:peptidoglycan/xylan/chitin deacetylase (PgdA/CDA1 family)
MTAARPSPLPLADQRLVRAINFHRTPPERRAEYERQLLAAGERYAAIGEDEAEALLAGAPWHAPRPPLLPVFFEGYRSNYEVALPLLERAGLRGWFFIPTTFLDTAPDAQRAFGHAHNIYLDPREEPGERHAMTWDELRDVAARGHVVACHTATHCSVADLRRAPQRARAELVDSKQRLEAELGTAVRTLAFLWGGAYGEDATVDAAVREAGYRMVMGGARLQRVRA